MSDDNDARKKSPLEEYVEARGQDFYTAQDLDQLWDNPIPEKDLWPALAGTYKAMLDTVIRKVGRDRLLRMLREPSGE